MIYCPEYEGQDQGEGEDVRQFLKFSTIAEIPIIDFPENRNINFNRIRFTSLLKKKNWYFRIKWLMNIVKLMLE